MRLGYIAWGLLLSAAAAPALAQTKLASSGQLTGQIETVYVRESSNLFIEKKLVKRPKNQELWVALRVEDPLRNEYVTELAQLPQEMAVERGDLVEAVIAESTLSQPVLYAVPRGLAPMPELSRVTALIARHDTGKAMLFGLNNSRPRRSLANSAQACFSPIPTAVAYSPPDSRAPAAH